MRKTHQNKFNNIIISYDPTQFFVFQAKIVLQIKSTKSVNKRLIELETTQS